MGIDLRQVFESLKSDFKALMGVKQCFSTALSVPFPAADLAAQGDIAMTASPLKPCVQDGDCQQGFVCQDLQSQAIKESGFDFFDLVFRGTTRDLFSDGSINVLSEDSDAPGQTPTESAEIARAERLRTPATASSSLQP